jgi:23S rRNA pseudouridine955/2504/2580 synthase
MTTEPDADSRGGVDLVVVDVADAGARIDRWFRRRFPQITHGRLEKWLRTGQVRVDGRRAKASQRLAGGETIRVPPLSAEGVHPRPATSTPMSDAEARDLRGRVLHRDRDVIVIDKPAGLAVQGGSGTARHLDGMLDVLAFDGERPRLVHRLDRDTAGVLVLARSRAAATALSRAFQGREVRKLYWALVAGVPPQRSGRISVPLAKRPGPRGETVQADQALGEWAVTRYHVVEAISDSLAWLALEPVTGRTHQVRVHCAALGTPIIGDGKYGGRGAFLSHTEIGSGVHLLARAIAFPHPAGGTVAVAAPLPPHMDRSWRAFNLSAESVVETLRRWDGAVSAR